MAIQSLVLSQGEKGNPPATGVYFHRPGGWIKRLAKRHADGMDNILGRIVEWLDELINFRLPFRYLNGR